MSSETEQLGPLLFQCKVRSRRKSIDALTGQGEVVYIAPFFFAFFLTIPFAFLADSLGALKPILQDPFWGPGIIGWFFVCLAGTFWYCLGTPRGPSLTVHEQGFVYQGKPVRFDTLASISVGRVDSGLRIGLMRFNEAAGTINRHARQAVRIHKASQRMSLTLELKDGSRWSMNSVLATQDEEDLVRFLDLIRAEHPELVAGLPR